MRIAKLENLARDEVGKSGSPLLFVTRNGDVVAVFVKTRGYVGLDEAVDFAERLGESCAVVVEDSSGVAWENGFSQRQQDQEG